MDASLFVQNVKLLCVKKNIKPTNACKEAGVGGSFLSDILNRGSVPSVAKVQMLAEYLGVTVSELLGEKEQPAVQDSELSPNERALMESFRQLSPEQQELVLGMVKAASDKL